MTDIKRASQAYIWQALGLCLLMTIALKVAMLTGGWSQMLNPIIVGVVFALLVETADALTWRAVAQKSPDSLPQFYTSASAFRMLLALATATGYYFAAGRGAMPAFLVVFGCYYLLMLCHHSIFFARVAKRQ